MLTQQTLRASQVQAFAPASSKRGLSAQRRVLVCYADASKPMQVSRCCRARRQCASHAGDMRVLQRRSWSLALVVARAAWLSRSS
jgi:hypothetical protein